MHFCWKSVAHICVHLLNSFCSIDLYVYHYNNSTVLITDCSFIVSLEFILLILNMFAHLKSFAYLRSWILKCLPINLLPPNPPYIWCDWHCIESIDQFGDNGLLNNTESMIHGHGIFPHLFSSSISLSKVLKMSWYRSFTYLIRISHVLVL